MENNKPYLQQFGKIFLIAAIYGIIEPIIIGDRFDSSGNRRLLFWVLVQVIPNTICFISIGLATGLWRAAIGSLAFFMAVTIAEMSFPNYRNQAFSQASWFYIRELIYLFNFFLFFLLAKVERKKLPTIALGVLLLLGFSGLYEAEGGFNWLKDLFHFGLNIPHSIFNGLTSAASQVVHVILICELLNYARGKNQGSQQRIINPGNEYNKITGTILYWSLTAFLFLAIIGCMSMLDSYSRFAKRGAYVSSLSFLRWYYLIGIIIHILLMLCVCWYLRKFLLEFFFTFNLQSKLLYWALLIPGVGFIVWLIMLVDIKKQPGFKERKKSLDEFSAASHRDIVVIFVVVTVIQLLWVLSVGHPGLAIPIIFSVVLFWLLVTSVIGYQINILLNFLLLGYLFICLLTGQYRDTLPVTYAFMVFNIVQLYLIYPVFHFEAFQYLSYEEEEVPWKPGMDLF